MTHRAVGSPRPAETLLIVNADDYGYYSCVSRGILEAAGQGAVTATGVLSNSPNFEEHVERLSAFGQLDVGVHLTLTFGAPLTERMRRALAPWGGRFPSSKLQLAVAVLSGRLPVEGVEEEWGAQVRRCRDAGLRIAFLNTHEHVHLLPPLGRTIYRVAAEHGIAYVRHLRPEWAGIRGVEGLVRNIAFLLARRPSGQSGRAKDPILVGVGGSGKLNLRYLERRLSSLRPGRVYELMCHPGRLDPDEIRDPRLLSYHRWDDEFEALTSERFRALCGAQGIRLAGFRDLAPTVAPGTPTLHVDQRRP